MSGAQALDVVERGPVSRDFPKPSLLNPIARIVVNPDQAIPVVVRCLRNPADRAARLAAWAIALDLIAQTVEGKVEPLLDGGSPLHRLGVVVFCHSEQHCCVVLRQDGGDRRRVAEPALPLKRRGDQEIPERGVHEA